MLPFLILPPTLHIFHCTALLNLFFYRVLPLSLVPSLLPPSLNPQPPTFLSPGELFKWPIVRDDRPVSAFVAPEIASSGLFGGGGETDVGME